MKNRQYFSFSFSALSFSLFQSLLTLLEKKNERRESAQGIECLNSIKSLLLIKRSRARTCNSIMTSRAIKSRLARHGIVLPVWSDSYISLSHLPQWWCSPFCTPKTSLVINPRVLLMSSLLTTASLKWADKMTIIVCVCACVRVCVCVCGGVWCVYQYNFL